MKKAESALDVSGNVRTFDPNAFEPDYLVEVTERYLAAVDRKNEAAGEVNAILNEAQRAGIDRRSFKLAVKAKTSPMSTETRSTTNAYLRALGDLPLFAQASQH